MFGIQREMHAYRHSLKRLDSYKELFDEVYPCHGTCPVKPELIMQLYDATGDILDGKVEGKPDDIFGNPVTSYDVGIATFLCDRV